MKKIALITIGCGHKDGSEITETVSAIIALSELKTEVSFFSFDEFFPVTDSEDHSQTRNSLSESQRITRGQSKNIKHLDPSDFDALIIPGGSGLLLNLTTFEKDNIFFKVNPDLEKVIYSFYETSKPIGAILICPTDIQPWSFSFYDCGLKFFNIFCIC